jgi:hypothetical protein
MIRTTLFAAVSLLSVAGSVALAGCQASAPVQHADAATIQHAVEHAQAQVAANSGAAR